MAQAKVIKLATERDRRSTYRMTHPIHNCAVIINNVLEWVRDGTIDDDLAFALIAEQTDLLLSIFEAKNQLLDPRATSDVEPWKRRPKEPKK